MKQAQMRQMSTSIPCSSPSKDSAYRPGLAVISLKSRSLSAFLLRFATGAPRMSVDQQRCWRQRLRRQWWRPATSARSAMGAAHFAYRISDDDVAVDRHRSGRRGGQSSSRRRFPPAYHFFAARPQHRYLVVPAAVATAPGPADAVDGSSPGNNRYHFRSWCASHCRCHHPRCLRGLTHFVPHGLFVSRHPVLERPASRGHPFPYEVERSVRLQNNEALYDLETNTQINYVVTCNVR
jgi:hypothetical protein